jgi:hypothetical protein
MSRTHHPRSGDSLRPDLQALVSQVGLDKGKFELVVHEGTIQFIVIKPAYRLVLHDSGSRKSEPGDAFIRLDEAEPFVLLHLEPLVSELIGRFGSLKVNVKDGVVVDWSFARRHR